MPFQLDYLSFVLSLALSGHGWRKSSLSASGAIGAFFIAYVLMAIPLRVFGISCIVFYLTGSRATKVGKKLKARLEVGHKEGGQRDVWQVLSNTFSALIASILWSGLYVQGSIWASLVPKSLGSGFPLDLSKHCPIDEHTGYSRFLILINLGHFACCLGDTLASELGILSKSRPILITTLKPVPPGTNGALSSVGTFVSFMGGAIMGLTVAAVLVVQSIPCREQAWSLTFNLVKWGFFAGGIGSLLDSLMGATIQKTRYSKKLNMILQDDSVARPEDEVTVVSGIGILTNGQINLISSAMTAIIIGYLAAF